MNSGISIALACIASFLAGSLFSGEQHYGGEIANLWAAVGGRKLRVAPRSKSSNQINETNIHDLADCSGDFQGEPCGQDTFHHVKQFLEMKKTGYAAFQGERRLQNNILNAVGDLNIRFNKIPPPYSRTDGAEFKTKSMTSMDYPISMQEAQRLRKTGAISVFHFGDCHECIIPPPELLQASGVKVTHPNSDPRSSYWLELVEVIYMQMFRRQNVPARFFLKRPQIWGDYTLPQLAEAVHDEYPGSIHALLIARLFGGPLNRVDAPNCPDCINVDRNIIPFKSDTEFVRGVVMLSDLNTYAFGAIGGMNFSVKWYVGRARPEEVAIKVYNDVLSEQDGVPPFIVTLIKANFQLGDMRNFTAYPEGSPDHPSFPAMHSASSAASLWMPVVLNLNTTQWCEVKAVDYAIAYARTIAGVHFPSDNIAGLNIGQEILSRLLPNYLNKKYGSNVEAVEKKIASVRFDWNDYLKSECFL